MRGRWTAGAPHARGDHSPARLGGDVRGERARSPDAYDGGPGRGGVDARVDRPVGGSPLGPVPPRVAHDAGHRGRTDRRRLRRRGPGASGDGCRRPCRGGARRLPWAIPDDDHPVGYQRLRQLAPVGARGLRPGTEQHLGSLGHRRGRVPDDRARQRLRRHAGGGPRRPTRHGRVDPVRPLRRPVDAGRRRDSPPGECQCAGTDGPTRLPSR